MHSHKITQLCRQVEEAIEYALASSADPILRDLHVVAVQPIRGSALLRVVLRGEEGSDEDAIEETIGRAGGYLRHEVGVAINRKRVPELRFVLAPGGSIPA